MTDFHFIPFAGRYLIYRPLKRLAFVGNKALVDYLRGRAVKSRAVPVQPDIEVFLREAGYWKPAMAPEVAAGLSVWRPSMAVLLMTNRCNLACTYCYAAAGSESPKDMPWPIARAVIDAAIANARAKSEGHFALSLHGGGEPTLNWPVLTAAVAHARAQSLPCRVSLASNGVWSRGITDFVCHNVDSVTLSFDGVRAVHDAQRPRRSRRSSFAAVLASIRALDTGKVGYGIRMTVTPAGIDRLVEGVQFLCCETGVRAIQIEASFTVTRGIYAETPADEAQRFVGAFLSASALAAKHGVCVSYSGARPWVIAHAFCQAPSQALVATPEGRLVTCFEATGDSHPYAREFTIGRVTPAGIEHDRAKYRRFQRQQELRRVKCTDCFCYWHCCGDCASRAMVSIAPTSVRCHVNREITKAILAGYVERDGGVWTGRMPAPDVVDADVS